MKIAIFLYLTLQSVINSFLVNRQTKPLNNVENIDSAKYITKDLIFAGSEVYITDLINICVGGISF